MNDDFTHAVAMLRGVDGIVFTAGAGMGVDSGLPDFRGTDGFWRAYPVAKKLGLTFEALANPHWFDEDPALAWGFYGHRLNLYRTTQPHAGFGVVSRLFKSLPRGGFVYTSNVDGAFQAAGFNEERLVECHGSIHHLQCSARCDPTIYDAADLEVKVDKENLRATSPLPKCMRCGQVLRPNVLMFGDPIWNHTRSSDQEDRFKSWLKHFQTPTAKLAIIEVGAGTHVSTIRGLSESLAVKLNAPLIRINKREAYGPPGTFSISMGAEHALIELEIALRT